MFARAILAALAVVFSVGTLMAQQDPVKTREDLMKKNNDHAKAVVQMMRGQATVRCRRGRRRVQAMG